MTRLINEGREGELIPSRPSVGAFPVFRYLFLAGFLAAVFFAAAFLGAAFFLLPFFFGVYSPPLIMSSSRADILSSPFGWGCTGSKFENTGVGTVLN